MKKQIPIACTLQPGAEVQEAMERYRRLFYDALLERERTDDGVRWTFRASDGVERRVRSLAAMEAQCCAFLRMDVVVTPDAVVWDVTGPPEARAFLDEYGSLPERLAHQ